MCSRCMSHPEFIRDFLGYTQWSTVYNVLHHREPFHPIIGLMVTEDSQQSFHCLICPFQLPISLWVVGRAQVLCDSQHMAQFSEP